MEEPIIIDSQMYPDEEYEPLRKTTKEGIKMVKESLMQEVRNEEAKEAIKAVETLISYCRFTNCTNCPFFQDCTCYLFSNSPTMPADWDLYDLKTN